ncbi:MAG: CRTAC1 family protein [Deltaproteobacteria bacterium]|nr:CRTAC1 family protein [Deltaproteobacteria bacterium]
MRKALPHTLTICAALALLTTLPACGSDGDGGGNAADSAGLDGAGSGDGSSGADAADVADAQGGDTGGANTDAGADTFDAGLSAPDWTPDRACNTGGGQLPVGLKEMAWDDGTAAGHVEAQADWAIVGSKVREAKLYEAVRFDVQGPVKIWGFRVQFGSAAAAADAPVTLGLYRDFGHNGFDFWAPNPIWTASRCGDQVSPGTWVDYRLPKPVQVEQPGLYYVAYLREGAGSPSLAFDGSLPEGCEDASKCCEKFDACHSAWNFPEITSYSAGGQQNIAWNGLSTSRPIDYLVRLLVEPTATDVPSQHRFVAETEIAFGHRMAIGDFDGDGWDDVWDSKSQLFRNNAGKLENVTEAAGIAELGLGANGGIWGDYDNDGDLDLLTFWETAGGGDHLLRNDGGVFTDVTEAAGISDLQSYNACPNGNGDDTVHEPTPAAAWLDLDADGHLDLYMANFICWGVYTYYVDRVWRNKGDGTFEEWTGKNGFWGEANPKLPSRGATPADYDGDGDVDLFVHTYVLLRDLLFRNEGGGTFAEVAEKVGVAGHPVISNGQKRYGHGIGSMWGDLNGDGLLDLVVANLAHPRFWDFSDKSSVFLQQKDGTFVDLQGSWDYPVGAAGLSYQETHSVPLLGDFDHDGKLDLWMSATYDGRPTEFYLGNGDGTFALARWMSGVIDRNGWGMAAGDLDHDGDLDVIAKNHRYTNQGAKGHWLQVRVVGDAGANRAGIGATIHVETADGTQLRVVDGGSGQGCQSLAPSHFGLGGSASVSKIRVVWPGGEKTEIPGPIEVDQAVRVFQSGKLEKGW